MHVDVNENGNVKVNANVNVGKKVKSKKDFFKVKNEKVKNGRMAKMVRKSSKKVKTKVKR